MPGKAGGEGWYALDAASVAGPNWPSKSRPAWGEIQNWRAESELPRLEGIAAVNLPRPQPGHEPARALFRRPMGESVGHHITLTPPLQPIVADGGCRLHGSFDIARFDEPPLFLRVVRPHPGKAVGLQLNSNLQLIALNRVHTALRLLHLGQDS